MSATDYLNLRQLADLLRDLGDPRVLQSADPHQLLRTWRQRGQLPDPDLEAGGDPYWSRRRFVDAHSLGRVGP